MARNQMYTYCNLQSTEIYVVLSVLNISKHETGLYPNQKVDIPTESSVRSSFFTVAPWLLQAYRQHQDSQYNNIWELDVPPNDDTTLDVYSTWRKCTQSSFPDLYSRDVGLHYITGDQHTLNCTSMHWPINVQDLAETLTLTLIV